MFYVSTSINYTKNTIPKKVLTVTPSYAIDKSEIETAKTIFNNGVSKAISLVDSSMTSVEKALIIHDYFCDIARYPTDAKNIYHSAYGIFYNGDTVCSGYSLAYSYVMNKLGVPTKHVVSTTMNHAWNIVQIGTYWYNVDITYDDWQYTSGLNAKGTALHKCFLKSTYALKQVSCFCHSGMQIPDELKCVSTDYDNYFWNDVSTNIAVKDHKFYYLDYQPNSGTITINNYTSSDALNGNIRLKVTDEYGNSEYVTDDIYTTKCTCGYSPVTAESGDSTIVPIDIPLSQLVILNGELYFSWTDTNIGYSNSRIYYYDFDTNKCVWLRGLDRPIYGMSNNGVSLIYAYDNAKTTYNVLSQKDVFYNAYTIVKGHNYNPYCDINNDGYINAKDYVMV